MSPSRSKKATTKRVSTASRQSNPLVKPESAFAVDLARALSSMIEAARTQVAVAVNAALTTLYWQIGHRVQTEVLEGRRAAYGAQIVATVSRQLTAQHGRGFDEKSLRRMVQFAGAFPDSEIVATLRRQLSWGHFKLLIPLKDELRRTFYAEMCRVEGWSVRALDARGIHVAEYLTELPPKRLLEERLHRAIELARHTQVMREDAHQPLASKKGVDKRGGSR